MKYTEVQQLRKQAVMMDSNNDPSPELEWQSSRMAHANPGVAFMWDDAKRRYIPTQYDIKKKTNVPYTGRINQPRPMTREDYWNRNMYIRQKQMPTTTTISLDGNSVRTQGRGRFRRGNYVQEGTYTRFPKTRKAPSAIQDVLGFR